jgi:glycosyltransferase involved in cell wall biosynthesis
MTIGIDASRAEAALKTGVERYSFELLRAMRENRPADARVVLYSRRPLPRELGPFDRDWKEAVLNWPPGMGWTQIRLSWEMLRRPPEALFVLGYHLPAVTPERTVVTIHDASFLEHPEVYPGGEARHQANVLRDTCRRAGLIIAPSNFTAAQIAGLRKDKVVVIPSGVPAPALPARRAPRAAGYFAVVGRIEKKKNLGVVADAFGKFSVKHPDYRLVFVGKPAYGAEGIMRQALAGPAGDRIEFRGALADAEMFAILGNAAALLHPCPYEGFGIPPIEAMALGVPAVVASAGAVAETVGEAGILVDPSDSGKWAEAMEKVLEPGVRADLVAKGKARAASYAWKRTAEATWRALAG